MTYHPSKGGAAARLTCDHATFEGGPAAKDVKRVTCPSEIAGRPTVKSLRALAHETGWSYLRAVKQDRCPQHPGPNLRAGRPMMRPWRNGLPTK